MNTISRNTFVLLGILGAIFLAFLLRQGMVNAPPFNPDGIFNTERAYERLSRILGDEAPHPVDSVENDAVRARLLNEITALGFSPIVRDDVHCVHRGNITCARVQNVLFWVTKPGDNAVMLLSHYDSVPAGPGAADDGIGVAASLEIAALLRERDFTRPVLVLITDGEEIGLIGASSFVQKDPLAKHVKAVINMEARGVSGAAALIQTSRPNGRDIQFPRLGARLPVSNSLSTDIYEMMPNDTDMSVFLPLGVDATNFAIGGSAYYYHTPHDNLANLDKGSLSHIGHGGLGAVEGFLRQKGDEAESQKIFADILGRWWLVIPQSWGMLLLGLGTIAALGLFFTRTAGAPILSAALPPLSLIVGTGFAIGATMLIAALRPEVHFGAAAPWAARAMQTLAALLGVMVVFAIGYRQQSGPRIHAASWFWFALIGLGLFQIAPGSAIIFVPPLVLFSISALLMILNLQLLSKIVGGLAAGLFLLLSLRLAAFGELALFIQNAAPFTALAILVFLLAGPLYLNGTAIAKIDRKLIVAVPLVGFVITGLCAMFVPAYSVHAPRAISIVHTLGQSPDQAQWAIRGTEPLPEAMTAAAAFKRGRAFGFSSERFVAPAPDFATDGVVYEMIDTRVERNLRFITLDIIAADTDRILIKGENGVTIRAVIMSKAEYDYPEKGANRLTCFGRACRNIRLVVVMDNAAEDPSLIAVSFLHGLGPQSSALIGTRPDWSTPQHWGDLRAIPKRIKF